MMDNKDNKTIRITKIQGTCFYNLFIDGELIESKVTMKQIIQFLDRKEKNTAEEENI